MILYMFFMPAEMWALFLSVGLWYNNEESGCHACMNSHLTRNTIETAGEMVQ